AGALREAGNHKLRRRSRKSPPIKQGFSFDLFIRQAADQFQFLEKSVLTGTFSLGKCGRWS
ncbi:MAG: hypothetical protein Q4E91_14430, partial [Lachnospiraceae bacterium]|nr:hypothetical protein [Lachnospiraceae bacterium]